VTVSSLQVHAGFASNTTSSSNNHQSGSPPPATATASANANNKKGGKGGAKSGSQEVVVDHAKLLDRFEQVQEQHTSFRMSLIQQKRLSSLSPSAAGGSSNALASASLTDASPDAALL
jgi:hypothetical protein